MFRMMYTEMSFKKLLHVDSLISFLQCQKKLQLQMLRLLLDVIVITAILYKMLIFYVWKLELNIYMANLYKHILCVLCCRIAL